MTESENSRPGGSKVHYNHYKPSGEVGTDGESFNPRAGVEEWTERLSLRSIIRSYRQCPCLDSMEGWGPERSV